MKVSKTDGQHLYINVLDFKDKDEQEKAFKHIVFLVERLNHE